MQDDIKVFLRLQIARSVSIEYLMERIMSGEDPEEALKLLRRLADEAHEHASPTENALAYLGAMCRSLDETEFRMFGLEPSEAEEKRTRRDRAILYDRYRILFEWEIATTRKQRRQTMALSGDWSGMSAYVRQAAHLARAKTMLRLAGWMYRAGIPGGKDMCEAAAYILFRLIYGTPRAIGTAS